MPLNLQPKSIRAELTVGIYLITLLIIEVKCIHEDDGLECIKGTDKSNQGKDSLVHLMFMFMI